MKNNEAPVTSTIRTRVSNKCIDRGEDTSNATVFYKYTFVQFYRTVDTLLSKAWRTCENFWKFGEHFSFYARIDDLILSFQRKIRVSYF